MSSWQLRLVPACQRSPDGVHGHPGVCWDGGDGLPFAAAHFKVGPKQRVTLLFLFSGWKVDHVDAGGDLDVVTVPRQCRVWCLCSSVHNGPLASNPAWE